MQYSILTALGADRPGLVDEVSLFIFDRGGNIEDSRMVNLRGQFAIMMAVTGADDVMRKLHDALPEFAQASGLHAQLRPAKDAAPYPAAEALPYRLVATAIDQPGIVHRVSHLLRRMQVNIESLETRLTPAPYTGAQLFEMELILSVPRGVSPARLRQDLAATCDPMNIDWELRSV